ncbi:hypothetical protein [Breznakiella homolactica]|uniref:Uncharacterized protein n=1 Tax=Breznakiella homolactica TaxID=2798577 RepID=A0A7T7XJN4_9SPIR|nr:hypothetical protein [Breznakiella homolactica]QQO07650.1 hypothetical protein JFL75_11910 [Breznakiella homolactica]
MNEQQQRRIRNENEKANLAMGASMAGGLGQIAIIAIVGALIAVVILVLGAGFRGALIAAKTFWLYPLVILVGIIVFAIIKTKAPILKGLLGFLAAAAVIVFGCMGATRYYQNSERYSASYYSGDYIQALPDGSVPKLYEKRHQKGATTELALDEKVIVNGISFDKSEFNITTANGVTGWVELEAFPEDARGTLAINLGLDGVDSEDVAIDRQTERLMARFYDVEEKGGNVDPKGYVSVKYKEYTLKSNVLNRFTKVNVETPFLYLFPKAYKKGEDFMDNGVKLKLAGVAYENDCTVLYMTVNYNTTNDKNIPYYWLPYGPINTNAWKESLTVTDLDTGEKWTVLQADYKKIWSYADTGSGPTNSLTTQMFFFPPFKSRHFSITHEADALPGKKKAGYGGILGLLSSMTGMSSLGDIYFDYEFPEVRVR